MSDKKQNKFVDIGNCRGPEMTARYEQIAEEGYDPFDPEVFKEEHGRPIIFENRHWILTTNQYPYEKTKFHYLVVCKDFVTKASEMTSKMWSSVGEIISFVEEKHEVDGHTLFMRMGNTKKTGASVVRLHFHIIVPEGESDERTAVYPVVSKK